MIMVGFRGNGVLLALAGEILGEYYDKKPDDQ